MTESYTPPERDERPDRSDEIAEDRRQDKMLEIADFPEDEALKMIENEHKLPF
jgi:hypothetical protein